MSERPRLQTLFDTALRGFLPLLAHSLTSLAIAGEPPPSTVEVYPGSVLLSGAHFRQQLVVTLRRADGALVDLTAEARFKVEPETLAKATPGGLVLPRAVGSGVLHVSAGGLETSLPLHVDRIDELLPTSYRLDVVPLLSKAGCNMGACHGNLHGKGGFRLSLRGGDAEADLLSLTRDALGRRTDLASPSSSLVLLKPTGQVPHEGGLRFTIDSPEYRSLLGWITGGARDDRGMAPAVSRIEIFPGERILTAPGLTQQLVVTAFFSDGSKRDVTRQAAYDVSDATKVTVSADGKVEASRPTETTIAVRYLTGRAVSRLTFLADRPGFAWRSPPERNDIDRLVFAKLKSVKVLPSEPSNDPVFLRRAYLDAIGRLPNVEEARAFLADQDPARRESVVRSLVRRPEFADFWALKWADLLRNEEKTMGEKGVWVFHRWLRDQIAADLPLDEFARLLITAKGSTWSNPPASFYRTNRDPMTAAESFGQVFLGVRLQCARCHNHPFDDWTQDDYYGLAAHFGNVRHKEIANVRKDDLDKHEINGDDVVYLAGEPEIVQPRSGVMMPPRPPHAPVVDRHGDRDARIALAAWLTTDNRQFARNMANRVWFHLLGRGVVDPVDDFRDSNPPSNPGLLELLADRLVSGGFRLRPLVEFIMTSQTYQLGAEPNETNADDEANFARSTVRLIPAEPLLDAIGQALGKPDRFSKSPRGLRATQLPGAGMGGKFLKAFGKPDRLLTCECERSESTTLAQAFQLINGESVRKMLEADDNRIGRLIASGTADDAILEDLTLTALSRHPTETEKSSFLAHVRKQSDRRKAWEDVAWAIVNSKEFLLRH